MASIALATDVPIPLRDGVTTRADVWRPAGAAPAPALLMRTPYLKELAWAPPLVDPRAIVVAGFCLVVQDVRGTGESEGDFEPFVHEGRDGADTIAWIAEQPWCDGRVAMIGGSYCGIGQLLAAAERPPALAAIVPALCADDAAEGWAFRDGSREHGLLTSWIAASLAPPERRWLADMPRAPADVAGLGEIAPWSRAWFAEGADSPYWRARSPGREAAELPALLLGGWYDVFVDGTIRAFARRRHPWDRLILGPWGHDLRLQHLVGEADLGIEGAGAAAGVAGRAFAFLHAVLAGEEPPGPRVLAYALGRRAWLALPDWPPPGHAPLELPLAGDGAFEVDPHDLPPTLGGRALLVSFPQSGFGVRDQRTLAERDDVLVLRTELPRDRATLLAGPISVALPVRASGGEHRDWTATLCRVRPDGRLDNLCEGIVRREAAADAVEIRLGDACVELPPGAELALLVAGGSFPRWAPVAQPGVQRVLPGGVLRVTTAPSPPIAK